MTDLSELLEGLAETPAPPSRLRPADLYAQGRRRHRRSVVTVAAAAGVGVATLVAGVALVTLDASPARPGPAGQSSPSGQTSPTGQTSPSGQAVRSYHGAVDAAAGSDADHLYAIVLDCTAAATTPPEWLDCRRDLVRSGDAGKTWQVRSRDIGAFDSIRLTAVTADIVVARAEKLVSAGRLAESGIHVSVDGGQTWKLVEHQATTTPAVAADGWVEPVYQLEHGVLSATDPRLARSAPLAGAPPLKYAGTSLRTATGSLWIDGADPASDRPAVAVSNDAGRSWATHVFTDIPAPVNSTYSTGIATLDGRIGYAVSMTGYGLDGGGRVWVHRTSDGGQTWQRVDPEGTAPWSYGGGRSYVTPGGAHVIADLGRDNRQAFWISRDGGARYARVTLDGLPEDRVGGGMPRPLPGGGYLANTDDAVYVSTDGLQWRRVVPQVP